MSYFGPPKPAKAPSDFLSEIENGGEKLEYQISEVCVAPAKPPSYFLPESGKVVEEFKYKIPEGCVSPAKPPSYFLPESGKVVEEFKYQIPEGCFAPAKAPYYLLPESGKVGEKFKYQIPEGYEAKVLKPAKVSSVDIENEGEKLQYQIPEGYEAKSSTAKRAASVRPKKMAHVEELEVRLGLLKDISWESIDKLMGGIAIKHGISPKRLHKDFKEKNGMIPDAWISKQKESVNEEIKTPMQILADRVASVTKPATESPSAEMTESIMEQKVFQLEKQLYDMRKMILEVTQANVSRLGSMETIGGSGEVRFERLDDVNVSTANDGDTLIWDSTLQRWIPASAGGFGDLVQIQRQIGRLEQKVISVDGKVEDIVIKDSLGLVLETGNAPDFDAPPTFIDGAPGGVSNFVVDINNRGIFTLDGIAQPSIQIYRGDSVDFDLSGLGDDSDFQIIIGGTVTSTGAVNRTGSNVIVDTGAIDSGITKFYYQSASDTSNGWIVAIIDP